MQSLRSAKERDVEDKIQEDVDSAAKNRLAELGVRKEILSHLPFKDFL